MIVVGLFWAYLCGRISGLIAAEVGGYWNFLMIIPFAIVSIIVTHKGE